MGIIYPCQATSGKLSRFYPLQRGKIALQFHHDERTTKSLHQGKRIHHKSLCGRFGRFVCISQKIPFRFKTPHRTTTPPHSACLTARTRHNRTEHFHRRSYYLAGGNMARHRRSCSRAGHQPGKVHRAALHQDSARHSRSPHHLPHLHPRGATITPFP